MTVHRVNGEYDRGEILFQARTAVEPGDTPESIATKVLELEHRFYPEVVEREAATWHT
jgi:phosphoribosylglycinamide formyltransferase-1